MFGIAVGNLDSQHPRCAPLAGKSTLNRLSSLRVQRTSVPRPLLCIALVQAIEQLLIDLFFNLSDPVPGRIFVDMDVTDDPVHGQQEQAFFWPQPRVLCSLADFLWSSLTLQPNSALVMWTQQRER